MANQAAKDVLAWMTRIEKGYAVSEGALVIDLNNPSLEDIERIEMLVAYQRALARETSANADAFEKFIRIARRRTGSARG